MVLKSGSAYHSLAFGQGTLSIAFLNSTMGSVYYWLIVKANGMSLPTLSSSWHSELPQWLGSHMHVSPVGATFSPITIHPHLGPEA